MDYAAYRRGMAMDSESDIRIGSAPTAPKPKYADLSPAQKTGANVKAWAILFIAAVALVACIVNATGGNDNGTGNGASLVACKNYVKARLKSPGTADFSGLDMTGSGGSVTVTGNVDSQNPFGALIRNTFTCEVSGSGDNWHLVSLTGLTN